MYICSHKYSVLYENYVSIEKEILEWKNIKLKMQSLRWIQVCKVEWKRIIDIWGYLVGRVGGNICWNVNGRNI